MGRSSDRNSLSSCCTWGGRPAAAVSGLQGLIKEMVLALVKVRPEAACRTCCLAGIIESSNFARKSMPRTGVATAASKKSNSKLWLSKQTVRQRRPQARLACHWPPQGADLWVAPSLNTAGLKWTHSNRLKILSYFANLSSLLVRKTWPRLIPVQKRRGGSRLG